MSINDTFLPKKQKGMSEDASRQLLLFKNFTTLL
jgi:hypothetical protein